MTPSSVAQTLEQCPQLTPSGELRTLELSLHLTVSIIIQLCNIGSEGRVN